MSKLDAFLSDVEQRLAKVTPWPWLAKKDPRRDGWRIGDATATDIAYAEDFGGSVVPTFDEADAAFIAHSPQDVAGLVAVVRAVRAMVQAQIVGDEERLKKYGSYSDSDTWTRCMVAPRITFAEELLAVMESAVPGSESQNDDEAKK